MARQRNSTRVRRRLWVMIAGVLAPALVACVPRVVVTQPHLLLHIRDEAGQVVPADVVLYWWEYPHRRQRGMMAESTDMQGIATFTETIATEVIMPLVPHGVPAYNWYFCIESDGYKTLIGTVSDVEPGATVEGNLTLHSGESFPVCADFERLPYYSGTPVDPVESSGGRVHDVYEVDAVAE